MGAVASPRLGQTRKHVRYATDGIERADETKLFEEYHQSRNLSKTFAINAYVTEMLAAALPIEDAKLWRHIRRSVHHEYRYKYLSCPKAFAEALTLFPHSKHITEL